MGINLPLTCRLSWQACAPKHPPSLTIALSALQAERTYTFAQWHRLGIDIQARYRLFQRQQLSIDAVLTSPWELVVLTWVLFHQSYRIQPGHWHCTLSDITDPTQRSLIGKGLGSSAAVIVGLLQNLFQQHRLTYTPSQLLDLACECEQYQHGFSSGLDPATQIEGGVIRFCKNQPIQSIDGPQIKGWLVDTGRPQPPTGKVVQAVQTQWPRHHGIWASFGQITDRIQHHFQAQQWPAFNQALNDNQQRLVHIGVVPERVQRFIQALHNALDSKDRRAGIKLCGAGAHLGQAGGMVFVHHSHCDPALCEAYGYPLFAIHTTQTGAQCHRVNTETEHD